MFKSLSQISKEKNFTRQYLSQFCKKNNILPNEENLYDLEEIERKLKSVNQVKSLHEKKKKGLQVSEVKKFEESSEDEFEDFTNIDDIKELMKNFKGKDYLEVKTEKEKILTIKAKLELDKLNNKLIDIEIVKNISYEVSKRFKDNILNLSNKVSPIIAGEVDPKVIKKILDEEIVKIIKDMERDIEKIYEQD